MIKKIVPHILGSLLVISTVYHSDTFYSFLVIIPLFLISFLIEKKGYDFVLPVLVGATLLQFLFISSPSINNIFALMVFFISFAVPLFFYWVALLSDGYEIRWRPISVAISYVIFTIAIFYLLPDLIGVSEFIMGEQNEAVQIMLFFGISMLVAVVYHAVLEIRY